MMTHRTVLKVEELGARVLPSATILPTAAAGTQVAKTTTTTAVVTHVASPSWQGHGRYTITTAAGVATYHLQGSADYGKQGFFAIKGTVQTVGNKSGQAHGRITLSDRRGTLTLDLVGPTQTAHSSLPAKFTYKVVSGTGFFARYAGQGTIQLATPFWPGWTDKGRRSNLYRVRNKPAIGPRNWRANRLDPVGNGVQLASQLPPMQRRRNGRSGYGAHKVARHA
jgi:hypothetical protein